MNSPSENKVSSLTSEVVREEKPILNTSSLSSVELSTPSKVEDNLSIETISSIGISSTPSKERRSHLMSPPEPNSGKKRPNPGSVELTPVQNKSLKAVGILSPESLQSPVDVAGKYTSRSNAGQTVSSFQSNLGHGLTAPGSARRSEVRLYSREGEESCHITQRYRYMYTTLKERARALENILISMQEKMKEHVPEQELTPVGIPRQESVWTVGRICCEAAEGKLNRTAVVLEGSARDSGGFRIQLDLQNLKACAVFPGQIVAVQGVNSSGHKMIVTKLVEGIPNPLSTLPAEKVLSYNHSTTWANGQPLSIMIAAGPFTTSDNLTYQPLEDLLAVVQKANPDLLILLGPFVDSNHPAISSGEPQLESSEGAPETVDFHTLFAYRVSEKLRAFYSDEKVKTQVVLVPSLRDAHHDCVYPQPPFEDKIEGGLPSPFYEGEKLASLEIPFTAGLEKRVHCVPNPATICFNEVTIGMTSNDVLFDLSSESLHVNAGNRLTKSAEHLIVQQSYFPIFPPTQSMLSQLDMRHSNKWKMPVTPDILIMPSKLAHFSKRVQNTLCINPGNLAKGISGGTYAQMTIHPLPKAQLQAISPGTKMIPSRVHERCFVEIKRI